MLEGAYTVPEQPPRVAISITREELRAILDVLTADTALHNNLRRDLAKIERRRGWSNDGERHTEH